MTLLLLTTFAILLALLIMYILNPDKAPLPWRAYCTFPPDSSNRPDLTSPGPSLQSYLSMGSADPTPPFPPPDFDSLPPAGVLVGVFSMDSAIERRMLVRTSWASHKRSRDGAGPGDGGNGTSRTIVRFILGIPAKSWERRIKLEMHSGFNRLRSSSLFILRPQRTETSSCSRYLKT